MKYNLIIKSQYTVLLTLIPFYTLVKKQLFG